MSSLLWLFVVVDDVACWKKLSTFSNKQFLADSLGESGDWKLPEICKSVYTMTDKMPGMQGEAEEHYSVWKTHFGKSFVSGSV